MQYALMQVSETTMVLMDASEVQALQTHGEKIVDVSEQDEENLPLKIVYGAYKPQHGKTINETMDSLKNSKGFWYGHIRDDKCYKIGLTDLVTLDTVIQGKSFYIPFVALVSTNIDLKNKSRTFAITSFLRYDNMNPAQNIINRKGILSIGSQENRIKKDILTVDNWKDFADLNRAKLTASKIY